MSDILLQGVERLLKTYSQMELPDPEDLDYYIGRNNRTFYIEDVIYRDDSGYSEISQLIKNIISINIEDIGKPIDERKPILVLIDSPGGDLELAFSLADVIQTSVTPVYTIALSSVMSAAFIIFLSGKKRFVFEHSQLLCHQGRIEGVSGTQEEIAAATKNYKDTLHKMREYILSRTTIDPKVFTKNQKKDWYISPKEATSESFGIADKIITSLSDVIVMN